MYKVFIDNKPIIFQFNSQLKDEVRPEIVWKEINSYLNSDDLVLSLSIKDERDFNMVFTDHMTIEAAGGLVQKENSFLFIKRNGYWDIPKGKLERNESTEECAIREVEEECGVDLPTIVRHLKNTWHTYEHKGRKIIKKTYWYLMKGSNDTETLSPQLDEGITEVRFIDIRDFQMVEENTFGSIIDVMDALVKSQNV